MQKSHTPTHIGVAAVKREHLRGCTPKRSDWNKDDLIYPSSIASVTSTFSIIHVYACMCIYIHISLTHVDQTLCKYYLQYCYYAISEFTTFSIIHVYRAKVFSRCPHCPYTFSISEKEVQVHVVQKYMHVLCRSLDQYYKHQAVQVL